nr:hypothetical protein [Saprospiraceae bacterium]
LFSVSLDLPILDLDLILHGDFHLGDIFPVDFKPLKYFKEFLQFGYYPFIVEGKKSYYQCIRQIVRTIVEYDMAEVKGFDIRQARKLLQLLYIISQHVPFKPNLSSLAQKSDIHRNSINNYLYFLDQSRLISLLYHHIFSISSLQKPEKYIWKIPTCYLQ